MNSALAAAEPEEPRPPVSQAALDAQTALYARQHRASVSAVARVLPAAGTAVHEALSTYLAQTTSTQENPHAAV